MTNNEANTKNEHDVKIAEVKAELGKHESTAKLELGKHEADLANALAEWKMKESLRHDKFIRVSVLIEKLAVVSIIGGFYTYNKKQVIQSRTMFDES